MSRNLIFVSTFVLDAGFIRKSGDRGSFLIKQKECCID